MNISDYYNDYANQKKHSVVLNDAPQTSNTINDFYNDCIKNTLLEKDTVLAWHNMLMEYVDLPDAIYWIRYYESKGKGYDKVTKRHNNRRACFTRFNDGFSYVFVSNFDAHEIFNMVSKGIIPTAQEFLALMNNFSFPMHYDPSKACEESDMVAYPHIGYHAAGVLTASRWYLAHINAVKSPYLMADGSARTLNESEAEHLFPRGVIADWPLDSSTGKHIRKLPYSLTDDEKNIVKAHFLRFIDPLNYFLTPATSNEIDSVTAKGKNIGEFDNLTEFMQDKYKAIYGTDAVSDFIKKALVPISSIHEDGTTVLNVQYGRQISTSGTTPSPKKAKVSSARTVKAVTPAGLEKIGVYAKKTFEDLLVNDKLSNAQLNELKDKKFCSDNFKISFPILVESTDSFEKKRYYKNLVKGRYYVCSQWVEKHRQYINIWKQNNNL